MLDMPCPEEILKSAKLHFNDDEQDKSENPCLFDIQTLPSSTVIYEEINFE